MEKFLLNREQSKCYSGFFCPWDLIQFWHKVYPKSQTMSNHDFYEFEMVRVLILKFLLQQRNSSDQERFFSLLHSADGPRKRSDTVLKTVILRVYGKNQPMFEDDDEMKKRFQKCYTEIKELNEDELALKLQSDIDPNSTPQQPSEQGSTLTHDSVNSTIGEPAAESTTIENGDPIPLNKDIIDSASFVQAVSSHSPLKKSRKRKQSDSNETDQPAKVTRHETLPKPIFGQSIIPESQNNTPVDDSTFDRSIDSTLTAHFDQNVGEEETTENGKPKRPMAKSSINDF